jgi:hypothetical protein
MLRGEEGLLDRVRGKSAGDVAGGRGFLIATGAAQQVGACRMEQVAAVRGRRTQLVHRGQSRGGTADLGERGGAVERNYRSRRERAELVAERQDGTPVGAVKAGRALVSIRHPSQDFLQAFRIAAGRTAGTAGARL